MEAIRLIQRTLGQRRLDKGEEGAVERDGWEAGSGLRSPGVGEEEQQRDRVYHKRGEAHHGQTLLHN